MRLFIEKNSSVQAKVGHDKLTKIRSRSTSAEDDDDYRAFQGNVSRSTLCGILFHNVNNIDHLPKYA